MAKVATKIVLPDKTNLSIQFCLNYFLRAFEKSLYLAFLRIFSVNFQFFQFPSQKISAFRADPNVPISGMVSPRAIKWREKKIRKIFKLGQYTGVRILDFSTFLEYYGYFFFIVPYNREINFFDPKN